MGGLNRRVSFDTDWGGRVACRYSSYAGLANLCDYAAAVVPVTVVDQELDERPPPHEFMSDTDELIYNSCRLEPLSQTHRGALR